MAIFIIFILWFILSEALLTLLQFFLSKKQVKKSVRIALVAAELIVAVLFAVLPMAGPVQLRIVQPFMMAAYVAMLSDACVNIVYSIILAIGKKQRNFKFQKCVSLLCGVLFLTYGIINMEVVTPKYHSYSSEKLTDDHKIVFAADLHVGSAQPFSVTEESVQKMKDAGAECIILGGDIVDDYTTKEEMENTFALFKGSPCPVYYLYGNHDRQGHAEYAGGVKFTQEELENAMSKNGVKVLKDEFVKLSNDLVLLGREDITEGEGRKKAEDLKTLDGGAYLIVADHQPVEFKENIKIGADLQLSGHTHAGQLAPLRQLYALIGGYVYGDYESDGAIMNVSAGACGWRVPLRTAANCHFEVIELHPAEE